MTRNQQIGRKALALPDGGITQCEFGIGVIDGAFLRHPNEVCGNIKANHFGARPGPPDCQRKLPRAATDIEHRPAGPRGNALKQALGQPRKGTVGLLIHRSPAGADLCPPVHSRRHSRNATSRQRCAQARFPLRLTADRQSIG